MWRLQKEYIEQLVKENAELKAKLNERPREKRKKIIGDEFWLLELWNEETWEWREYKYKWENIYWEKVYAPTLTSYFIK